MPTSQDCVPRGSLCTCGLDSKTAQKKKLCRSCQNKPAHLEKANFGSRQRFATYGRVQHVVQSVNMELSAFSWLAARTKHASWSQTCGEHARTPRPPRRLLILGRTASAPPLLLHNVDVPARVDCLFLRDLRDRMHAFARFPVTWRPDAAVVAITDGEEDTITPHSACACLNLQILVHDDPSTTAWTLSR